MGLKIAFRPSKPCIPHLAPATLHPKSMASCSTATCSSWGRLVRCWQSTEMAAAMKVSPAPSVSTTFAGEWHGDVTVGPGLRRAAAPVSPQGQMTAPLRREEQAVSIAWRQKRGFLCEGYLPFLGVLQILFNSLLFVLDANHHCMFFANKDVISMAA